MTDNKNSCCSVCSKPIPEGQITCTSCEAIIRSLDGATVEDKSRKAREAVPLRRGIKRSEPLPDLPAYPEFPEALPASVRWVRVLAFGLIAAAIVFVLYLWVVLLGEEGSVSSGLTPSLSSSKAAPEKYSKVEKQLLIETEDFLQALEYNDLDYQYDMLSKNAKKRYSPSEYSEEIGEFPENLEFRVLSVYVDPTKKEGRTYIGIFDKEELSEFSSDLESDTAAKNPFLSVTMWWVKEDKIWKYVFNGEFSNLSELLTSSGQETGLSEESSSQPPSVLFP